MKTLPPAPVFQRSTAQSGHSFIIAMMVLMVISSLSALAIVRTSGSARLNSRASDYAEGERVRMP